MDICEVTHVTDEIVAAFARLIPQLSSSSPAPTQAHLQAIASSPACTLFIARDPEQDGRIVGTLTLATFPIPTGVISWIEDVVVDGEARGKGIGELLTRAAMVKAKELGAKTVDLTSRPTREAANRLYQRVGFKLRETNSYRYMVEYP
jgi:ribosomal protein S18 acetylase RimI-like enzyme